MCDLKDLERENDFWKYKQWQQERRNKKIDKAIKVLEEMKNIL